MFEDISELTDFLKTKEYEYFLLNDFIIKYPDGDSLLFMFEDDLHRTLTVAKEGEWAKRYKVENGKVVFYMDRNEYDLSNAYSYKEIIRFPMFYADNTNKKIPYRSDLEDGHYFGKLYGVNSDGSEAFVLLGKRIDITPERIDVIKVGESLDEVFGVKEFYHFSTAIDASDICVLEDFIVDDDKIDLFGEEAFLSEDHGWHLYFYDYYCVTTDECITTIKIDPNCEIKEEIKYDDKPELQSANAMQSTDMYYYRVKSRRNESYNTTQFFEVEKIIDDVVIKDGKIVKMSIRELPEE